jgi:hypothetical protein
MILAEDFWLRGKAAQSSLMQLWAYNTAFAGTATIQAWKMGLTAPTGFWQAMARAWRASNASAHDVVADAQAEEGAGEEGPATPRRRPDREIRRPGRHSKAAKPKAVAAPCPAPANPRRSAPARIFWTRRAAARPMT